MLRSNLIKKIKSSLVIFWELMILFFHGTSVNELSESFHNCIENYLDHCAEVGKEPEKEFKGCFNVRLKPEQHKKIALCAASEGITINQFVSRAIDAELSCFEG